jgi:predicted nucleic acid-binding Zn ribbon protein
MKEKRLCPVCNEAILGRIDKKFCSDQCRNTYNNRRYSSANNYVQKVNRTLKKNHSILSSLNTSGKTKVSRSRLLHEGFDFNYFTGIYETQKGNMYKICYNEGYLPLSDETVLLIHWKGEV